MDFGTKCGVREMHKQPYSSQTGGRIEAVGFEEVEGRAAASWWIFGER